MSTLYVSKYKEHAYDSILEALEHAEDNDVIEISSGTYDEVIVLRKSVTLHGHGVVIITGDLVAAPKIEVTIQNIQFHEVFETKDAIVHFENCAFHMLSTAQSIMAEDATVTFTDCSFNGQTKDATKTFIALSDSKAIVTKCHMIGNQYAISAKNSDITIEQSVLEAQRDSQIHLEHTQLHTTNCRFQSSHKAIYAVDSSNVTIQDSYFANHTDTQITLQDTTITLRGSQLKEAKHHLDARNSHAVVTATLFSQAADSQLLLSDNATLNAKHVELSYGDSHAVLATNSALHFKQSKITQHKAKDKAQLHLSNCQLHMDDSSMSRGMQRAIFAEQQCVVTLYATHFATHHAVQLEMLGGRTTITNCEFQAELSSAILLAEQVEAKISSCAFLIAAKNHITLAAQSNVSIADCRFDRCGGNDINAKNITLTLSNIAINGHPSEYPAVYLMQTQFTMDNMTFANCRGIALQLVDHSNGTAQHITFHNNSDINIDLLNSEAILKHLSIQGGTYGIYAHHSKLTIHDIQCERQKYDGIRMIENGHLLLSNATFKHAAQYGLASEYCTLSIEHSQFMHNQNGLYTKGATVTMNDSQIAQSAHTGIEALSSSFNLIDTLFSYNVGTQFDATRSTLQLQNTFFNHGKHALILRNKVNATFNNVACTDHTDTTICADQSTIIGKKCLFTNGGDYGIKGKSSQFTFTNSRFKGHHKNEFYLENSSEAVLTDCELAPSRSDERGATIFDSSTVSLNGYMMYRKRSS